MIETIRSLEDLRRKTHVVETKAAARCSKCESGDIIRDGAVFDMDRGMTFNLQAGFMARPGAVFFKGRTYNSVRATICGNCGFVELFVEDPKGLFAEYRNARSQGE